jgi:hypothetical protein
MRVDDGNFPATTLGGLQRACSINYAFIAIPENVMPLLKHVNCSIASLPYKTYPISLAMAFSPKSPYTDFWNYRRVPSVLHLLDRMCPREYPLTWPYLRCYYIKALEMTSPQIIR